MDEVRRDWRKQHIDELHDLYSSQNTIWVIKSRRMRWAVNTELMGEKRGEYNVLVEKLEGRGHLEHLCADETIILKLIFNK